MTYGYPITHEDYRKYHKQINQAEKLIGNEHFQEALNVYKDIFNSFDFVFLRDYKIAAQLAIYINEKESAFELIKKGMAAGWEMKSVERNGLFSKLKKEPEWEILEEAYPDLRKQYLNRINNNTRVQVQEMFKKDQRKALGALLRIGNKAKEKYALRKFAPHSEIQMKRLINILENDGYPGERVIGNNYWMSTLISHHNSITREYVQKVTLYKFIQPLLRKALEKGQISPYEFAMIDDWYIAVSSGRTEPGYGFLNSPRNSSLANTDELRQSIGLRTLALRNKLVDIENNTGLKFYLPDWIKGKIEIEQD